VPSISLPRAFDPRQETHKFLARAKTKASKNFRWTSSKCLSNATTLAFWSHVFGRDEDALEICRFLAQCQFTGNFSLWSSVELALALQSRLLRKLRQRAEARQCIKRIQEAGFVASRLKGDLLDRDYLKIAIKEGRKILEREIRLRMLQELCFMIELGGSKTFPVASLERDYQETMNRLRNMVGASGDV
jgi:hypothetical protein